MDAGEERRMWMIGFCTKTGSSSSASMMAMAEHIVQKAVANNYMAFIAGCRLSVYANLPSGQEALAGADRAWS